MQHHSDGSRLIKIKLQYDNSELKKTARWMPPYREGHVVSKEHEVAQVNLHAMGCHGVMDLSDDDVARCLDAQRLAHLIDVVGHCAAALDSFKRVKHGCSFSMESYK